MEAVCCTTAWLCDQTAGGYYIYLCISSVPSGALLNCPMRLLFYRWLSLPSVNTVSAPGLWEFIREHLNHTAELYQRDRQRGTNQFGGMQAQVELSACVNGRLAGYQYILSRAEQGGGRWLSFFWGVGRLEGKLTVSIVEVGNKCTSTRGDAVTLSLSCNKKLKLSPRCRRMVQHTCTTH